MKVFNILKGLLYKLKGKNNEIRRERILVCDNCEFKKNNIFGGNCKACGCFLELKTRIPSESCPFEFWGTVQQPVVAGSEDDNKAL